MGRELTLTDAQMKSLGLDPDAMRLLMNTDTSFTCGDCNKNFWPTASYRSDLIHNDNLAVRCDSCEPSEEAVQKFWDEVWS